MSKIKTKTYTIQESMDALLNYHKNKIKEHIDDGDITFGFDSYLGGGQFDAALLGLPEGSGSDELRKARTKFDETLLRKAEEMAAEKVTEAFFDWLDKQPNLSYVRDSRYDWKLCVTVKGKDKKTEENIESIKNWKPKDEK